MSAKNGLNLSGAGRRIRWRVSELTPGALVPLQLTRAQDPEPLELSEGTDLSPTPGWACPLKQPVLDRLCRGAGMSTLSPLPRAKQTAARRKGCWST